jgi:hypothetical protein
MSKLNISVEGIAYRLKSVSVEDAEFIIEVRLEDASRNQYINRISGSVDDQINWIKKHLLKNDDYYFVIENKLTGQKEGLIGLYDVKDGSAEWGRWVLKKGSLASVESVDLILKFAFENLKLPKVYCHTIAENKTVVAFHDNIKELRSSEPGPMITLQDVQYESIEHFVTLDHYYEVIRPQLEEKSLSIFQRNFRQLFGKYEFHHIGIATSNIEKEIINYRFLGYRREGMPFEDTLQGIRGQFMVANGQPRIELLENLSGHKTLDMWLQNKSRIYHFAYTVENIEKIVSVLNQNRIRTISPLKISSYFGKRICFLLFPNLFMIELIES